VIDDSDLEEEGRGNALTNYIAQVESLLGVIQGSARDDPQAESYSGLKRLIFSCKAGWIIVTSVQLR